MSDTPLPPVEAAILARVAERLRLGLGRYGPWNLGDGRDLTEEATQEALDMIIYLIAWLMQMAEAKADTTTQPEGDDS
jgi:hypothetical protein